MANLKDHLRDIIIQINKAKGCMPSELRVRDDQHGYIGQISWVNGTFICTVLGVPCYVDTSVSSDTPAFKRYPLTAVQTTSYTKDSVGPKRY